MRGLLCLPLLLLTVGCWQPRYFTPRENLNGNVAQGQPAAFLRDRDTSVARPKGAVRNWPGGAKARFVEAGRHHEAGREHGAERQVVVRHVGCEIENTGDAPIELEVDPLSLE